MQTKVYTTPKLLQMKVLKMLHEVLKYDINNGLWAKWTLSLHNGFLYIDRIGY
jgi:hypothetical protein